MEVLGIDHPIVFQGCPAKHLVGSDVDMWFEAYRWLTERGKMPTDFGEPGRLDPRFPAAMDVVGWSVKKYKDAT